MSLAALACAIQPHTHNHRNNLQQSPTSSSTDYTNENMMTIPPDAPVISAAYYASGSLPRVNNNQNKRPISRNSMSLTRSSSVRNSWASTATRLTQVNPPAVGEISSIKISPRSSIAPSDSISVNNRHLLGCNGCGNSLIIDPNTKNKYNTLTPAEAKKLNKFINPRQPARTASVLHKPRPPPMVVTNLDNLDDLGLKARLPQQPAAPAHPGNQCIGMNYSSSGTRCASSCSNHSNYRDQRNSINLGQHFNNRYAFSTSNNNNNNNNKQASQASPNDSESNLSFRSSLDIVDSAYGSDRLQTTSVDLGHTQQNLHCNATNLTYKHSDNQHQDILSNKLSDESYSSARSHQSDASKLKSLSKVSLSSSTTKVFQNHLYNLKKFFRNMPTRRSVVNNYRKDEDANHGDKPSLAESVSQICLNRSQSPPTCPPPPGELKSISYMENSNVIYSNYDEFTRARNQQTSSLLNSHTLHSQQQATSKDCRADNVNSDSLEEFESWQLASLPVSCERNLATVFEEKQNLNDCPKNSDKNYLSINNNNFDNRHLIKPPPDFEDSNYVNLVPDRQRSAPSTSSSQSLTSITTADSVLDFHKQSATSYRFSYGQPRSFEQHANSQNNSGLPPRMPISEMKQGTTSSSSSTSGSNNCDQRDTNLNNSSCDNNYSTANGFDNDGDTTIRSDSSTINGDLNNLSHKCAELERTVNSLKNKLISKEKELTDLQLKQWSTDYLVDQLKSTIGRLEKENTHLKAVLENVNRVNL